MPVAFDSFCVTLADEMQRLAPRHEILYSSVGNDMTLNIDPKLMRQAIVNLLQNAVKYSPVQSTVRLQVTFSPGVKYGLVSPIRVLASLKMIYGTCSSRSTVPPTWAISPAPALAW